MRPRFLIMVLLAVVNTLHGQWHQPVFPDLEGQLLLDSLVSAFKPPTLLPQAMGRDTLFGKIDNLNDSLHCVYTGYTIWLDPALDPTQAAFMNGGPNGLNTEHTYPKSLGANGLAEGDLHNLYATRIDVNADRGNLPFAEIPDSQTLTWYRLQQQQSTIPGNHLDEYAELGLNAFEPPEKHKGNVARSMMYFYTMYREQADQADPLYFEAQRETLCAWHFLDPVDEMEWTRTWAIAGYQAGRPNPFVLDCSLAERSYCAGNGLSCAVAAKEQRENSAVRLAFFPNPIAEGTTLHYYLPAAGRVSLQLFDAWGRQTASLLNEWQAAGWHQTFWQRTSDVPAGTVFCRLVLVSPVGVVFSFGKMMLLPF